jgi:hypothetical protein
MADMTNTVEDRVNQLFRRLIEGKLQTAGPRLESGWEMSLPSGETVVRSTLQAEAQAAIELGTEAIPYLAPYVRNENLAIRYVAIYALEQITGEKSRSLFQSPGGRR